MTRILQDIAAPYVPPLNEIVYPDSDGERIAENTEQFDYIVDIKLGLEWQFADRADVFVAGDLLWYPIEGDNKTRIAPDIFTAFGRPKGRRESYMQWKEGGIPPQVVFEIRSPGNTAAEMKRKLQFYERFGVEEYYLFDPDRESLRGYRRVGKNLVEIPVMNGWTSPRLQVRFELIEGTLKLFGPDGQPFASYVEMAKSKMLEEERAKQEQRHAEQERKRADRAKKQAEKAQQLAEQERQRAEESQRHAEREKQRAEQEKQRADQLAAYLRSRGIEPPEGLR